MVAAHRAEERSAGPEGEYTAVGCRQVVAVTALGNNDGDDGSLEPCAGQGSVQDGATEGSDLTVGGNQVIAVFFAGGCDSDDRACQAGARCGAMKGNRLQRRRRVR